MKIPYVGSDLDGTIVKNKDFEISSETINDINLFQKASQNKFFIITGRVYENIKRYIRQLNVTLPIITSNGGTIIDPITQQVYFEKVIDKNIVLELLNFSYQNNLDVSIYTSKTLCCLKSGERIAIYNILYKDFPEIDKPNFIVYDNLLDLINDVKNDKYNTVKFMFSFDEKLDEEKILQLENYLEEKNLYHPKAKIQSRILIDAMPKEINKFYGVKKWAEIMKIDLDKIFVIGDNHNDLEMISGMKHGIAVGNAVDNLKNQAWKVIKGIDQNGVGLYLKELIDKEQ